MYTKSCSHSFGMEEVSFCLGVVAQCIVTGLLVTRPGFDSGRKLTFSVVPPVRSIRGFIKKTGSFDVVHSFVQLTAIKLPVSFSGSPSWTEQRQAKDTAATI